MFTFTIFYGKYVLLTLRNNSFFPMSGFQERACEHIPSAPDLFAAPQCLGYQNERGKATLSMCLPSFDVIITQLKRVIRNGKDIMSVYVASDNDYMLDRLGEALSRMKVSYIHHIVLSISVNVCFHRYQCSGRNRRYPHIWI